MKFATILTTLLIIASQALAYPNYTGYSGSPGRQACSISCHHSHSFTPTITVTGFPTSYVPGQQYIIAVAHNGGTFISNFNCSVRIGTGSSNAGVIAGGTNTSTYNTSGETNGVHMITSFTDSGSFRWTAPAQGIGDVRLYLAILQGGVFSGTDTQIVLVSTENVTGIDDPPPIPGGFMLAQNYPNPFNSETIIDFAVSRSGDAKFEINNILGQQVYSLVRHLDSPGKYSFSWNGKNAEGINLPSGIYFYRLSTIEEIQTRKMTLLK
jgi:hypothetical protein